LSQDSIAYEKAKAFASRIVKTYVSLTERRREFVMSKQLLRAGTSIGANLAEATCSISRPEFLVKVGIAQKEAQETLYWLELLRDNGYLKEEDLVSLVDDCRQLLRILSATIKTTRINISSEGKK